MNPAPPRAATPERRSRTAVWAAAAGVLVLLAAAGMQASLKARLQDRGQRLFDGRLPLTARIDGHGDALPPSAAACANCHAGSQAIGGALSRSGLETPRSRRGGPPSRYDESAFCRLLREGQDPAWVTLPRDMPRYAIDGDACAALWAYVRTL